MSALIWLRVYNHDFDVDLQFVQLHNITSSCLYPGLHNLFKQDSDQHESHESFGYFGHCAHINQLVHHIYFPLVTNLFLL